jgi:hypothetical protein
VFGGEQDNDFGVGRQSCTLSARNFARSICKIARMRVRRTLHCRLLPDYHVDLGWHRFQLISGERFPPLFGLDPCTDIGLGTIG